MFSVHLEWFQNICSTIGSPVSPYYWRLFNMVLYRNGSGYLVGTIHKPPTFPALPVHLFVMNVRSRSWLHHSQVCTGGGCHWKATQSKCVFRRSSILAQVVVPPSCLLNQFTFSRVLHCGSSDGLSRSPPKSVYPSAQETVVQDALHSAHNDPNTINWLSRDQVRGG